MSCHKQGRSANVHRTNANAATSNTDWRSRTKSRAFDHEGRKFAVAGDETEFHWSVTLRRRVGTIQQSESARRLQVSWRCQRACVQSLALCSALQRAADEM